MENPKILEIKEDLIRKISRCDEYLNHHRKTIKCEEAELKKLLEERQELLEAFNQLFGQAKEGE